MGVEPMFFSERQCIGPQKCGLARSHTSKKGQTMTDTLSNHQAIQIEAVKCDKSLDPTYIEARIAQIRSGSTFVTATTLAKSVRRLLKRNFPGVKFSVRSGRHGGTVNWTDGPSMDKVGQTLGAFALSARLDWTGDYRESISVFVHPDGTTCYEQEPGALPFSPMLEFRTKREMSEVVRLNALKKTRAYFQRETLWEPGVPGIPTYIRDEDGVRVAMGQRERRCFDEFAAA